MKTINLLTRMSIAIAIMIIPFNIFEFLFSDITLYLSYNFLKTLGYNVHLAGDLLKINNYALKFIPACVATSAYYLLTLLILLTRNISLRKAITLFTLGSALILIANVVRVDILIIVLINYGYYAFESLHLLIWKIISSIYVALIWIILTYLTNTKEIPIWSDLKHLIKNIKSR